MPLVTPPVNVVELPHLTITEFFGNVATSDPRLSAAHVKITAAGAEEWQTPEFDEYVLILQGEVHLRHEGGTTAVPAGAGVFLRQGVRVQWIFPGPCEYVPICLPAFSPGNVHREEEQGADGAADDAAAASEPDPEASVDGLTVFEPVDVVKVPNLTITEYFGNVASADAGLSACLATVSAECAEAFQAPDFDEYVLVLSGEVHLLQASGKTVAGPGSAVFLKAGERVKWMWPGECTYIPICLPAFTPMNCHREEEDGAAKDRAAMERLHALHKSEAPLEEMEPEVQLGA